GRAAAIAVAIRMGVSPRGSSWRGLLEISRLLDSYAVLSSPVQVTMACPSSASADPKADPDLRPGAGQWHGGFTPAAQADWAETFAALALCKPFVSGVYWAHFGDATGHRFPHCG